MKKLLLILLAAILILLPSCTKIPDEPLSPVDSGKDEGLCGEEYIKYKLENSDTASLELPEINSDANVEYAKIFEVDSGRLPKKLLRLSGYDYTPVIYEEKDIFPDSKEKNIYLVYFYRFRDTGFSVDRLSKLSVEDTVLTAEFDIFQFGMAGELECPRLFVVKIDAASLSEAPKRAECIFNTTTESQHIDAVYSSSDRRTCDVSGIDTDIEIVSIEVIQNVKRVHSIPYTYEHEGGFFASRFGGAGLPYQASQPEYKEIKIVLSSGEKTVKFDRIISTEAEGVFSKVVTFNVALKEVPNGSGEEYCEIAIIKYKSETLSAIEHGTLTIDVKYILE